jgi:hypothetical protein
VSLCQHPGPAQAVPGARLAVGGDGDRRGGVTSRLAGAARLTSHLPGWLTGGLGGASQLAVGVALDRGPHQGTERGTFGLGPGLGRVPDLVFDPGGPLRCWHMPIIPCQGAY